MRSSLALLIASAMLAAPASAITPTGADLAAKYGPPAVVQTTLTGFGDNYSELDALYAGGDTSQVCFGVAGNMEGNGNAVVILLDTKAGGDEILGLSTPDLGGTHKVRNAYGKLSFDADFRPDYAIEFDRFNGGPGNDNVYGNYINLLTGENAFIGSAPVDGGVGGSDPNFTFALNNTNTAGVNGTGAGTLGDPGAVTTGLEFCVNGGFLGLNPALAEYKAMVYLVGGNGDYFSNQFLPGIPAGSADGGGNWGGGPIDLRQFPGNQFVALRATGAPIPEPGTLALLGFGILPFLRRRK